MTRTEDAIREREKRTRDANRKRLIESRPPSKAQQAADEKAKKS
jgi:hypothetical protein